MNRSVKISSALVIAFVVAVSAFVVLGPDDSPASAVTSQAESDPQSVLVRDDSRRLNSAPDGSVTFVEFLDFECEACLAAYPTVEKLRQDYGDRVSFVVRYFPIPSHFNAERAARAVEAAAQQGRFEVMYQKMYDTQAEWGEQRVPKDELFRSFAAELGLDLAAYDAAYADPVTLARIQADIADGQALGVQGTPTFFVDGTRVEASNSGDLIDALDAALR